MHRSGFSVLPAPRLKNRLSEINKNIRLIALFGYVHLLQKMGHRDLADVFRSSSRARLPFLLVVYNLLLVNSVYRLRNNQLSF